MNNDSSPRLDVTDAELAIVRAHVPDWAVWAFGSRVRGTAKPYSDLDLAVLGDERLSIDTLAAVNVDQPRTRPRRHPPGGRGELA